MESTELSDLGFARAIQQYRDFVDPGWVDIIADLGLLSEIVEARGCYLVDQDGRKYLDLIAGFGAAILGHNHPDLGQAIVSAAGSGVPSLQPLGVSRSNAMLAEKLCALAGGELNKVHFASTGAEAIEHAMRVAMVVTGRAQFVSWKGAYHGLTLGALGLADASSPWRAPLDDWAPSSIAAELTDLEGTRALLQTEKVAAVVIEVVQGIGGCRIYECLRSLQDLCTASGTLLIVDEVLTGLGRTGTWFAFQNVQEPCIPDMVVVSKGLSCGVTPMSAVLLREDVWNCHAQACGPGLSHSSTLAGNLLSVSVALASLATLQRCDLLRNVRESGDLLVAGLNTLRKQPIGVGDVCGRGLLLSFTVEDHGESTPETAARCWRQLLKRGVLASIAAHSPTHIKLTPPLVIGRSEIEQFVEALGDSIAESRI